MTPTCMAGDSMNVRIQGAGRVIADKNSVFTSQAEPGALPLQYPWILENPWPAMDVPGGGASDAEDLAALHDSLESRGPSVAYETFRKKLGL
jgi:hypothetical protein